MVSMDLLKAVSACLLFHLTAQKFSPHEVQRSVDIERTILGHNVCISQEKNVHFRSEKCQRHLASATIIPGFVPSLA